MGKRGTLAVAALTLALGGCAGGENMSKSDKETLKGALNKPVDVEKIRAEYNKSKGGGAGNGPKAATNDF